MKPNKYAALSMIIPTVAVSLITPSAFANDNENNATAPGSETVDTNTSDTSTQPSIPLHAVSATIDGQDVNVTTKDNTVVADGSIDVKVTKDSVLKLTYSDGSTRTVPATSYRTVRQNFLGVDDYKQVGALTAGADNTYKDSVNVQTSHAWSEGEETTITSPTGMNFTKNEQGDYSATLPNIALSDKNVPETNEIELSDGTKLPITWGNVETVTNDGATTVVRHGTAKYHTSRIGGTTSWSNSGTHPTGNGTSNDLPVTIPITITASRSQDTSIKTLTLETTTPDGTKTSTPIPGFQPNTHEYTITLPAAAAANAYTLNTTTGVDATQTAPTTSLTPNGGRDTSITINNTTYTIHINFQPADIQPDSPAKLEGIYINTSGQATKGNLINNWNPNRLEYTINLGANDPSPFILPISPEGVTIKAGKVTQTSQSATQEWQVTDTTTGTSRTYKVTVTRPVETKVTKFKPNKPIAQDQTTPADSDTDTTLDSHGYVDKNGKYHTINGNNYQIPEGGVFSYQTKTGQTATVTSTRQGMTVTYKVTVLPKQTSALPASYTFTTTYITEATHKAQLTGITVDGNKVNEFNTDKHEYTVTVNNPDEWTIVPQYDKTTGMTVTTNKTGADATITVTSGDGLVKTVYKVHANRSLFGGQGSSGVSLAETGSNVRTLTFAAIGALLVAAIAAAATVLTRKHSKRGKHETTDTENSSAENNQ